MTVPPLKGFVGTKELSARPWKLDDEEIPPIWVFALDGDYELK